MKKVGKWRGWEVKREENEESREGKSEKSREVQRIGKWREKRIEKWKEKGREKIREVKRIGKEVCQERKLCQVSGFTAVNWNGRESQAVRRDSYRLSGSPFSS